MSMRLKRNVICLVVMTLCLSCAVTAQAKRIFGDSFEKSCGLTADENTFHSIAAVGE